jgi:hypothetical protein
VLERIANHEGVGCVKIGGEVWTARSLDEDQVIERREQVEVVEIKGRHGARHALAKGVPWSEDRRRRARRRRCCCRGARTIRSIPQARAGCVERLGRYTARSSPG